MGKKKRTDANFSNLSQHKMKKKSLIPPFLGLPGLQMMSWRDERMPEMLWAVLLTGALSRNGYLEIFRAISDGRPFQEYKGSLGLGHSDLAIVEANIRDQILGRIFSNTEALAALSPLLLFSDLPDREFWASKLRPLEDGAEAEMWSALGNAVMHVLDHQSEKSTDIRWLKVRFQISSGRVRVPETMEKEIREIIEFPNLGDMRSVRPRIRSMEMMDNSLLREKHHVWSGQFWDICRMSTECLSAEIDNVRPPFPYEDIVKVWVSVYRDLMIHFMSTMKSTRVDARHDGAFGLSLYALTLLSNALRPNANLVGGRMILRSLVDVVITLGYLVKKDKPELWTAYRNYGSGQSKLTFLKMVEVNELPDFIDFPTLEMFANEDIWLEFQPIDVGHWAGLNLRTLAQDCGTKTLYDKYYDWPSGFVHGHWGAVRDTVFQQCMNPLHRLHRVPRPPRHNFPSVAGDCLRLANVALDLINEAYPAFKPRFPKLPAAGEAMTEGEVAGGGGWSTLRQ